MSRIGKTSIEIPTGVKIEKVKNDTDRDNFLIASEAVKYGLIDKVILPS